MTFPSTSHCSIVLFCLAVLLFKLAALQTAKIDRSEWETVPVVAILIQARTTTPTTTAGGQAAAALPS